MELVARARTESRSQALVQGQPSKEGHCSGVYSVVAISTVDARRSLGLNENVMDS
jgi:hypothetical protein